MKKIFLFVFAVLIFSASFIVYAADDVENVIQIKANNSCLNRDVSVFVTNYKGNPIKEAKVTVMNMNRKTDYGFTDDQGVFIYKKQNTKTGLNVITVKKDGFKDGEYSINISGQCVMSTTSTTVFETTTTSSSTTTSSTTTTTVPVCNSDFICEGGNGENFSNCPSDCGGSADGICDGLSDQRCDPDCERGSDPDCFCNSDGVCDSDFETYDNCPQDCKKGEKDSYCDRTADGICDLDCTSGEDSDCKPLIDFSALLVPLVLIIVVFGVVVFFNMRRAKSIVSAERSQDDFIDTLKSRLKDGEDPAEIRKELIASGKDVKLLDIAEKKIWE